MNKIKRQAIDRIDNNHLYVYNQWENGTFTRYLITTQNDGLQAMGKNETITLIPGGLKWVEVGTDTQIQL